MATKKNSNWWKKAAALMTAGAALLAAVTGTGVFGWLFTGGKIEDANTAQRVVVVNRPPASQNSNDPKQVPPVGVNKRPAQQTARAFTESGDVEQNDNNLAKSGSEANTHGTDKRAPPHVHNSNKPDKLKGHADI